MNDAPRKGFKDHALHILTSLRHDPFRALGVIMFPLFLWSALDRESIFSATFGVAAVGFLLFSRSEKTHHKQVQLGIALLGGAVVGLVVTLATVEVDLIGLKQDNVFGRLEALERLSTLEGRLRHAEDRVEEIRQLVRVADKCRLALKGTEGDSFRIPEPCQRFLENDA